MTMACNARRTLLVSGWCWCVLIMVAVVGLGLGTPGHAQTFQLPQSGGEPAVIVLAESTPPANKQAAQDLADTLLAMTGSKLSVVRGLPNPAPKHAIWIGQQPALATLFPKVDFKLTEPEQILIVVGADHVAVFGRDRVVNDIQTEFGTANAVYTFMQRNLGVRWLWPGELGTDLIKQSPLSLKPDEYRFTPILRERRFRYPTTRVQPECNRWWDVLQRGRGSMVSQYDHSFTKWWDLYHKDHPDYFALQPNGKRDLSGAGDHSYWVKLCDSNPVVVQQWLANTEQLLKENPDRIAVGASPNDGSGWCVCPKCKAWDLPNAGTDEQGREILTDRFVKFWNILACGLKQRFPDRELILDVMAYGRYSTPPLGEKLEDNIAVAYVGAFPLCSNALRQKQKESCLGWAKMVKSVKYRPNLFWYSGGVWGLPSVDFDRTIEDYRFLAENKGVSIDVDSVFLNFATQGPQLYLMAQLAYDPLQDGQALLKDYFQRGFGGGAAEVQAYFRLMEQKHLQIVEAEGYKSGMGGRVGVIDSFQNVYTQTTLNQARKLLDQAMSKAATDTHRRRVAFVRSGVEFTDLQMQILAAMNTVRATKGAAAAAVAKAIALCEARENMVKQFEPFAIDLWRINYHIDVRKMRDYLGPPITTQTPATRPTAQQFKLAATPTRAAPKTTAAKIEGDPTINHSPDVE